MDNNKQSCTNCEHFLPHYVFSHSCFIKINCGHCLKRKLTCRDYARFPFYNGCEQWSSAASKNEQQRENLKEVLIKTAENINLFIMKLEEK